MCESSAIVILRARRSSSMKSTKRTTPVHRKQIKKMTDGATSVREVAREIAREIALNRATGATINREPAVRGRMMQRVSYPVLRYALLGFFGTVVCSFARLFFLLGRSRGVQPQPCLFFLFNSTTLLCSSGDSCDFLCPWTAPSIALHPDGGSLIAVSLFWILCRQSRTVTASQAGS